MIYIVRPVSIFFGVIYHTLDLGVYKYEFNTICFDLMRIQAVDSHPPAVNQCIV